MQMRVKMQQPAYKCEKMQMRAVFVNGPIPAPHTHKHARAYTRMHVHTYAHAQEHPGAI